MQEQDNTARAKSVADEAVRAVSRGYQPIPILGGAKRSSVSGWNRLRWAQSDEGEQLVREKFLEWAEQDPPNDNLGLLLGEPSGGLVDVDLDHPTAVRLKEHFLPHTPMRSGRSSRPSTHYWYKVEPETVPGTRVYKLTDKQTVSVELRSTGGQTVVPPSKLEDGEEYLWSGEPWGGESGPTEVDGRVLQVQVAVLGLASALVDVWPREGSRHAAYLALAGGLLRVGDGVHPYWERNLPALIGAIADVTHDDDGAELRIAQVMETTLKRLRTGKTVQGFTTLGEYIGAEQVRHIQMLVSEVESAAGVPDRRSGNISVDKIAQVVEEREAKLSQRDSAHHGEHEKIDMEQFDGDDEIPDDSEEDEASFEEILDEDPLDDRVGTWEAVNLDPYLSGQVQRVEPLIMQRTDGNFLMYQGRVNMLFGPSEAAKSWIAMQTCIQHIEQGQRVLYLDFEDEPVNALSRLLLLGASTDDLRTYFTYVLPEEPLAPMERSRWGDATTSEVGLLNHGLFEKLLDRIDPTLIIADGISELYGLHGLDTNDTSHTATITRWFKKITRNGRTTVIAIDHAPKNPQRGTMPIGSQHKVSMVQGALIQCYPVKQPMPGAIGEIEMIVLKDRPGGVRAIGEKGGEKAQLVARAVLDSTNEGRSYLTFQPPADGSTAQPDAKTVEINAEHSYAAERAMKERAEEQDVIRLYQGDLEEEKTKREIAELLYGADPEAKRMRRLDRTLARLVEQGWIRAEGSTRDRVYLLEIGVEE